MGGVIISLKFFSTASEAKKYTRILDDQGCKIVNYTPSKYDALPADSYYDHNYETAHHVIGQEYDQVAAIMDQYFYYDTEGKLFTRGFKPNYHPTKMLFQILTRTRKKLTLIIIRNEEVLQTCLNILQGE
ncbi:hypothetical protein [Paenibacillus peoriae]|uniref:hypothetical protein n=1 Tax=Paenibacillus peoriae TaxID=59893 RepID=UPI00097004AA|nr:hypothetical protein [Paenibacillus peoriae]OMF70390.1 hypothetical protein BK143_17970 [Paenibacillus peoriae]OMF81319.1 hypothetical protein BK145_07850 [Paenibacillus peoriae]